MQIVKHKVQPFQGIYANKVATLDKGIENGIVRGSHVTFAEQIVLSSHNRGTLSAYHRVVVYLITAIKCVSSQTRPQFVGIVYRFSHTVGWGALAAHTLHPHFHCIHNGDSLGLSLRCDLLTCRIARTKIFLKRIKYNTLLILT